MPYDPATYKPSELERRVSALVGNRFFWGAVIVAAVALPVVKALQTELPPLPPKIRRLPDFQLVDQDGRAFGSEQLKGKIWVADFVYTSCGTICPKLTAAMKSVHYRARNMKGFTHLVSFTVDPRHDIPSVLFDFARKNNALGSGDWSFVTGELEPIRSLVKSGFGLGMDRISADEPARDPAAELFDISHGQQIVLVDTDLWVRGFYEPDKPGLDRLLCDMGLIGNLDAPNPAAPGSHPARADASGETHK